MADRMADSSDQPTVAQVDAPMTLLDRCIAAGGASVVSALVVNPLDVVKTRLQAQATGTPLHVVPQYANQHALRAWELAGCQAVCQRLALAGGGNSGATSWPTRLPPVPSTLPASCTTHCYAYDGTLDALLKISRQEGPGALWRGTGVSLLMAVPSVGIYLPLYDGLYSSLREHSNELWAPYTPLAAGIVARATTVTATSPLELLRTRLQAGQARHKLPDASQSSSLALPKWWRGVGGAWRGLRATLARDVPFSAIYWGTVEPIRQTMLSVSNEGVTWSTQEVSCQADGNCCAKDGLAESAAALQRQGNAWAAVLQQGPSLQRVFAANVVAGSTAGALAAAVTTPLDVIKTQVQLSTGSGRQPVWPALRHLTKEKGVQGLFAGVGARAARTAPACAIVLSSYEMLKHYHR